MARIHGMAGEWARVKGTVVGLWPLFAGLFLAGFASAVLLFVSSSWGIGLVCIALAGICFSLMYGVRRTERFFIGARGEERVSWILRSLPDKYHVFNNFIAGRVCSNITELNYQALAWCHEQNSRYHKAIDCVPGKAAD